MPSSRRAGRDRRARARLGLHLWALRAVRRGSGPRRVFKAYVRRDTVGGRTAVKDFPSTLQEPGSVAAPTEPYREDRSSRAFESGVRAAWGLSQVYPG